MARGRVGAMQLSRSNMSGPPARFGGYSGPRASAGNAVARNFFRVVNNQNNLRSITKGPWVPSFGGVGIGAGRRAQMRGQLNSVGAFQNAVMANSARNRQTIVKYRDPRTGAVSDYPISRMNLGKFGSQGWRTQQNSSGQSRNKGYSSGMSQFAINAPSGVGLNKMR